MAFGGLAPSGVCIQAMIDTSNTDFSIPAGIGCNWNDRLQTLGSSNEAQDEMIKRPIMIW